MSYFVPAGEGARRTDPGRGDMVAVVVKDDREEKVNLFASEQREMKRIRRLGWCAVWSAGKRQVGRSIGKILIPTLKTRFAVEEGQTFSNG